MQHEADAKCRGDKGEAAEIGPGIAAASSRLPRQAPLPLLLRRLAAAAEHVHARAASLANQLLRQWPVQQLQPARTRRLHDDDVGEIIVARVVGDRVRDILAGQRDRLPTQALRQAQRFGNPVAFRFAHAQVAPGLDMDRRPGRLQAVRHPFGVAHHVDAARIAADAGQHALAGRPGPGDRVGLHVADHLFVDPLRRATQREFAQRGQIAGREIVTDCALGLVRHIDLAVLQALDQVVRRQIDQFDVVGLVDDRIRHRLAHPDPGDPRDDVVQAFDVLDVERGVDIDAGSDQFIDIHVALGMPAARRVGVRQFIDQRQLWASCQQGVEIHLLQHAPLYSTRCRGITSMPSSSASVSFRPWVSTTPTTTSMPSCKRALAAVSISYVLPTPGAAPTKIFKRPRDSCCAACSSASAEGRSSRKPDFPSASPSVLRSIKPIADSAMIQNMHRLLGIELDLAP